MKARAMPDSFAFRIEPPIDRSRHGIGGARNMVLIGMIINKLKHKIDKDGVGQDRGQEK
jgi:hypothetical protein